MEAAANDLPPEMRATMTHLHLHIASRSPAMTVVAILERIKHVLALETACGDAAGEERPCVLDRELIVITTKRYDGYEAIQALGCSLLVTLGAGYYASGSTPRLLDWENCALDAVLYAMRRFEDSVNIQEDGMQILFDLREYVGKTVSVAGNAPISKPTATVFLVTLQRMTLNIESKSCLNEESA